MVACVRAVCRIFLMVVSCLHIYAGVFSFTLLDTRSTMIIMGSIEDFSRETAK